MPFGVKPQNACRGFSISPAVMAAMRQHCLAIGLPCRVASQPRRRPCIATGVAQVVAYFGPVYDRQSTLAETAFYTEIARGRRTRDAVRAARLAMARPFLPLERETARDDSVQSPDGTTPFSLGTTGVLSSRSGLSTGHPCPAEVRHDRRSPTRARGGTGLCLWAQLRIAQRFYWATEGIACVAS